VYQPSGQGGQGWSPVLVHGAGRRRRRSGSRGHGPGKGPRSARSDTKGSRAREEGPHFRAAQGHDDPVRDHGALRRGARLPEAGRPGHGSHRGRRGAADPRGGGRPGHPHEDPRLEQPAQRPEGDPRRAPPDQAFARSARGAATGRRRDPGGGGGWEGDERPRYGRLAKRGFLPYGGKNPYAVVNLGALGGFVANAVVDPAALAQAGLIKGRDQARVKILGTGEVAHALTVKAHAVSASARAKIEAKGGRVEVLGARVTAS